MMQDVAAPFHQTTDAAVKAAASPIFQTATGRLAETVAARQRELAEMVAFNDLQLDSAAFKLAGLPPQPRFNFPPLPKPMMVELSEPLRMELPEPVEPPLLKQGWVWGAIGSALVALDIVLRST